MKTVAFVANGEMDWRELKPSVIGHERVVAVDGGLRFCDAMGVRPDLVVGDFDSCPKELLEKYRDVPMVRLERDKDETDLEAAVRGEGICRGTLFGAWGKRIDHSLANMMLLVRYPKMLTLETEMEWVVGIAGKRGLKCFPGQTLSLIPVGGAVEGIVTKGLKWELNGRRMDKQFLGVSNVCLGEKIEIEVKEGVIICAMLRRGAGSA